MKQLNFIVLTVFLCFTQIYAGSLGGASNSYFAYRAAHNVFYDQQSAVGYVRMDNGFSVVSPAAGARSTHGSSVFLDTCISVSGYIDLRNTSTMILVSDLHLDAGCSFSSSGRIYGKNTALILHGNLNLPSNIVLHFGGNMAIEGNGNTLNLGDNSELFIDTDATLTLRNLIVSNSKNGVGNPAIKLASSGSQLALDNSILDMTGDFYFNRGSMFIHNDVIFTGTNAFVYRSCQPSFITHGAALMFDVGTTFSFCPATVTVCPYTVSRTYTSNNFIKMQDTTSKIIFNGCDFYTTLTGLNLTIGEVDFDNKNRLRSAATNDIPLNNITAPTVYSASSSAGTNSAEWSPDGRYLAVANNAELRIFQFTGSGNPTQVGIVTLSNAYCVRWSPDGQFLSVSQLNSPGTINVYRFMGSSNPVLVGSAATGASPYTPVWSPDGKFIVVPCADGNLIQTFRFTGVGAPVLVNTLNNGLAGQTHIAWAPDGKYFACVNTSGSSYLNIYKFRDGSPVLSGSISLGTDTSAYSVDWSPDGRYISVASTDLNFLRIFRYTGSGNPILIGTYSGTSLFFVHGWSPDGRFIAVPIFGTSRLFIFRFTESDAPTLIGSVATDTNPHSAKWSPDMKYIAVANYSAGTIQIFTVNYTNNTQQQAMTNSISFGNSALGLNYDLNIRLLAGSQVDVDGLVNYDNVN